MTALDDAFAAKKSTRPGVSRTRELDRIIQLPRRVLDLDAGTIDGKPIPDLTPVFLKLAGPCSEYPRCPICASGKPARIWPTQSAALLEAERGYGLFGPLGVGSGKTLVALLLPDVLGSRKAVILVKPSLKNQLVSRDMAAYGRHFELPLDRIAVVAYSELSEANTADILEQIEPDLVVSDEAHSLAHSDAARTKRFIRFMRGHPGTRFCALSGTMTRRSLRDYAGLCEVALRAGSPVPGNWSDINDWSFALDPSADPMPIGALKALAPNDPRLGTENEQVAAREGFRSRLVDTPGVVATSLSWEGASLIVEALSVEMPATVKDVLQELRETWEIGGEEIMDASKFFEAARQVALGFYYRWDWPNGEPNKAWLQARADWHRQVRQILRLSREGLDSPLLVTRAAKKKQLNVVAQEAWAAWEPLSQIEPPPIKTVTISNYVAKVIDKWAAKNKTGIVWYHHQAVGALIEGFSELPVYGAGTDAGEADPAQQPVIACSITSQGDGKNLQRYANNFVLEPPSSGSTWEQLIGRTHRPGQTADEVRFDVLAHTSEFMGSLYKAISQAEYVEQTQGLKQKLLRASRIGW